jgi:cytochrome c oxidase subunit I+III
MTLALFGNGTAYASLAFGMLFLWMVAPNWPPPLLLQPGLVASALTVAGLTAAAFAATRSINPAVLARAPQRERWLTATAAGHGAAFAGLVMLMEAVPDPTRHAYLAATLVLLAYVALHAALGVVFAGYGIVRSRSGYVSAVRSLDLRIGGQWHRYTAAIGLISLLVVQGLPRIMAP